LANIGTKENYDPLDRARRQETRYFNDTDLVYCIDYFDDNGTQLGTEYRYAPNDMWMYTLRYYYRGTYPYKSAFECNREFYDHFDEYGLSHEWYKDYSEQIYYNGEGNSFGQLPQVIETSLPDGSRGIARILLKKNGNGTYYDSSESYDKDGNLISLYRSEEDWPYDFTYAEKYEYEDGVLVMSYIYDYKNGTATRTEYENGEPVYTDTWPIDEPGNLIE
ncbi:MAG: hypothetical protein IKX97_07470, partial [Erysipelotrichaceae bacterium]|nr:hypothetical protein [Erysipelotrichaceae bacterium]